MAKLDNILVYHWQAWQGFLISHLVADYCHLEAQYEDTMQTLESRLTPNIRAVLLQINLTHSDIFPAQRNALIQALQQRQIPVLNADINDISKRQLHLLLEKSGLCSAKARQQGFDNELLFVKSNLNWGGEVEQRLPDTLKKPFLSQQHKLVNGWDKYYSARRADIHPALWLDSSIVIEKYIENPEQSFFRVYGFGEAIVIVKAHSAALIKKLNEDPRDSNFCFTREQIMKESCSIPAALQHNIKTFICHYPLAYFCLDIVHDLHNYFIIDLNLTPYSGEQSQNDNATHFLIDGAHQHIKNLQQRELMTV
ncbi:hypothetical protein MNBD_GAMMA11-1609 [hydrothermal vent metagenome]|uniref:ATP-grasp domain-containing protein n=1 Tax=hydrothermal vent metagenome TaxID=652676 RepID=A0A3B0XZL1_9ZZZZ